MAVDHRTFRDTVGQFLTGVTVIVSDVGGAIRGMTANAFTSLSLDPPLVLFCVDKRTRMGQQIQQASTFSVNILRREQKDVCAFFAGMWKQPDRPPYSFSAWAGAQRLDGCAASLACAVHQIHEGGDHWIVIGRVLAVERSADRCLPLAYFGGRYVDVDVDVASVG